MIRLWGLVVLIVYVVALVDVWQQERDLEKRLLWSVIIIVFPFIGALCWYLVSRKIIKL